GKLRQKEEVALEKRRTFARFGIKSKYGKRQIKEDDIKRVFNVKLVSERLSLSGVVDMAIITPYEVIPVDFKDGAFSVGEVVALHHKYQLLGYGLLLEEVYNRRSERGFILSLEDGSTKSVYFTDGARMYLTGKLRKLREMITNEIIPEESPYRGRCRECEFKPICKG
ncbi:MAG: CRISPR-associated protein Cas4, partial [Pseudothermotoga sp.]